MGKYPIFQDPLLDIAEENMQPCGTKPNFLGYDSRKLSQILADDQHTVNSMGLSHKVIAKRLKVIAELAKEGWGDPVVIDDIFEVEIFEARGAIPCPWSHPGLYRKNHIRLKHIETGQILARSDLAIHLIEEHGFYQGKGSPYRLVPDKVKKFLKL